LSGEGEYGGGVEVELHPAGYRLAANPEDVDAHRFARLAAEGRRALAAGDPTRAAELLREALDLWRGAALADVLDAPFARAEAARLEELRLSAVEDRVEARLELGAHGQLIGQLRAAVAAHPLRERPRGQLMRALHASGRRAEALAEFADARRVFADTFGTDPSADLAAIHVAVLRADGAPAHAGSRPDSGPGRVPDPGPAAPRLPGQLTSFVGRDGELRRVGKLLGQARLVTLTGAGGSGKTRLAVEAAGRMAGVAQAGDVCADDVCANDVCANDVCFVELAAVGDGEDVPQAVLNALGLRDSGLRDPGLRDPGLRDPGVRAADGRHPDVTDRLIAALAGRSVLVVLDNCEHLVADAAQLAARLLGACPTVRILATGREPLGLTGEALCPVTGLASPPEGTPATAAQEYAAVRLFADRAADVAPDFAVTPDNIDAVGRICRTLDGLPLAIELAAARLHALPVAEVAARLDDRFRLLSRGSRTAQPRHQTLRAVVEWSWDLLDDAERVLARRLTVFTGGATLEAVERVCGLPEHEVVDLLAGLVGKSLVEVAGGRYRMLDTVHAFCAEQLAEDEAEAGRVRRAHTAYFLDLAQTADPHLRRAEQLDWLRRLDAERDNLHAALRRALATADADTAADTGIDVDAALRLVAALVFYWWVRGLRGEGAALAGELRAQIGSESPPGLDEEFALCVLTASLGGSAPVETHHAADFTESMIQKLGRPPRQPFLLFLAGMATGPPVQDPDALAALQEQWSTLIGADPWSRALTALGLGMTRMLGGQLEQAQRDLAVALDGFRGVGDRWGALMVLGAMAEFGSWPDGGGPSSPAAFPGSPAAPGSPAFPGSPATVHEALRLADELGSTLDQADLLRVRGDGRLRAGEFDLARADYERAVELARRSGAPETAAAAGAGLGDVARVRGDFVEARRWYEAALAECPVGWFGAEASRFGILVALGQVAEAAGDAVAARDWYRRALTGTVGVRSMPGLPTAVEGLVGFELARGDGEQVALLLGAVTALLPAATAAGAGDTTGIATAAKSLVGDAAYQDALDRGAAMTREQALDTIAGRSWGSG
jgi:predicted ATPase